MCFFAERTMWLGTWKLYVLLNSKGNKIKKKETQIMFKRLLYLLVAEPVKKICIINTSLNNYNTWLLLIISWIVKISYLNDIFLFCNAVKIIVLDKSYWEIYCFLHPSKFWKSNIFLEQSTFKYRIENLTL